MAEKQPLWIQRLAYTAREDRALIEALYGRGALIGIDAATAPTFSLLVVQRQLGANMSVDVLQGGAIIPSAVTALGKYLCRNDSVVNIPITANASGNPRIDIIVAQVFDTVSDPNSTQDGWTLRAIAGTPTGGATLANRNGAATVPAGAIILADVIVANGETTIDSVDIEDRRENPTIVASPSLMTGVKAVRSTTQSINSGPGAGAAILYNTTDVYDNTPTAIAIPFQGGMHNPSGSSNFIRIPYDGVYSITANVLWASSASATFRTLEIRANSSTPALHKEMDTQVAGFPFHQSIHAELNLNMGDVIEVWAEQGSGAAMNIGGPNPVDNYVTVHHMGRVI